MRGEPKVREMHQPRDWQLSATALLAVFVLSAPATASVPKDCIQMVNAKAATVHQGRYNILCIHPGAHALTIACKTDRVPGASRLMVHPHQFAPAEEAAIAIERSGQSFTLTGKGGGADARVFFSYDGPFDPIRDQYSLTCHWERD